MPEVKIIVADDGEMTEEKDGIYAELIREGHKVILLPFDSGFGKKSNAIAAALDTEFLLVSSDDFNHGEPSVRVGIEKMLEVLDREPSLSIVSGTVDNQSYEYFLIEEDSIVTEWKITPFMAQYYVGWIPCDLTKNYSLIRRNVFWTEGLETNENGTGYVEKRTNIGWDNDVKIGGGEHAAFFLDVKQAGLAVAYVPGVNINAQESSDSVEYNKFRRRACRPERECFKRRGIKKYILADGTVDYAVE
jgi:hypothetical protein